MASFSSTIVYDGDVRLIIGRFLNKAGHLERLRSVSSALNIGLRELAYPTVSPTGEIVGYVTYFSTQQGWLNVQQSPVAQNGQLRNLNEPGPTYSSSSSRG